MAFTLPLAEESPQTFVLFLLPFFYLAFGYIFVALGALFYNFMFKYIGGVEYELRGNDA